MLRANNEVMSFLFALYTFATKAITLFKWGKNGVFATSLFRLISGKKISCPLSTLPLRATVAKRSSARPTAAKFGEANAESVISFCLSFFIQPRNDGSPPLQLRGTKQEAIRNKAEFINKINAQNGAEWSIALNFQLYNSAAYNRV
jgi:hypothetical protein